MSDGGAGHGNAAKWRKCMLLQVGRTSPGFIKLCPVIPLLVNAQGLVGEEWLELRGSPDPCATLT